MRNIRVDLNSLYGHSDVITAKQSANRLFEDINLWFFTFFPAISQSIQLEPKRRNEM